MADGTRAKVIAKKVDFDACNGLIWAWDSPWFKFDEKGELAPWQKRF
ncbi:MAG TPA: hypothetical protein V6C65_13000 [Allocoleopsis sp.]